MKQVRNLFSHAEDCKRSLRELAILRRLDHDCVVRLHDVFLPSSVGFNEIYIVMEICDSDMKKLVGTDVTLSMQHLRFLLYNLLKGLKYLGSAGVIHRDLKPGNVLVNHNCEVKICDFNLACVVDDEFHGAPVALEEASASSTELSHATRPIVPSTARATRQMTQRVVTRWYRAPEVILLQTRYTKAIDMWSAGCVFGELLQMLEDGLPVEDRGPLFPGSRCFPLSPYSRRREPGHDMLGLIFNLLGMPTEQELQSLDRTDARRYVRQFPASRGQGLQARFPWIEGAALDVLTRMLRFDVLGRLTADEALDHEFFADMRFREEETTAATPISLGIDHEHSLDERCLRHYFIQEVRHFGSPVREGAAGGA